MQSVKAHLLSVIARAAGAEPGQIHLEHPEVENHGDYSSNIALILKGGRPLAEKIAAVITPDEIIEKTEVAGPGFVNIWLQKSYLVKELQRVLKENDGYGRSDDGKGKRVIIDYSAPNIAKRFGIGHLRSTIIGQAIYNLHRYLGYEVIGDNHLGDWGTQFGKLLYMIDREKPGELSIGLLEELYVRFHAQAAENNGMEEEARKWFRRLEEGEAHARELWEKCVEVSMGEFERIYKLLEVEIDIAYGESFYEQKMIEVIEEARQKGIARESQGAWVIETPAIKTPLMLVKSDGGTTYATRDLATLKFRRDKWQPKKIVYEVGGEQTLHFQQVFAAARLLGYAEKETELVHTRHGLYLSAGGKKFSTRKGDSIKLEEVLEEAIERARKLGNTDQAAVVGIGAVKYFDLMHQVQSDIVFDWEKIMNLEGNSGPYIQYTFARTQSVMGKVQNFSYNELSLYEGQLHPEEEMIIRWVYKFSEVVEESASRYAPNLLANFLYELAQRYNTFYNKHSILTPQGGTEAELQRIRLFRLLLTEATGQVLKNGLNLLGIQAPERM